MPGRVVRVHVWAGVGAWACAARRVAYVCPGGRVRGGWAGVGGLNDHWNSLRPGGFIIQHFGCRSRNYRCDLEGVDMTTGILLEFKIRPFRAI